MRKIFFAIFMSCMLISPALADLTLRFDGGSGPFTYAEGSTFTVDLYLDATGTDATNIANIGLGDANPLVTSSGFAQFQVATPPVGDAAFDLFNNGVVDNSSAARLELSSLFGTSGTLNGSTRSVRLGTFTLFSNSAGSGSLAASVYNGVGDAFTLADGPPATVLDTSINSGSFNFTITAVPEPTSMATAGVLGLAGAWYARRRKKNSAKPGVDEAPAA